MGFRAITSAFQAQINEYKDRPVNQEMIEDIEDILEEYCVTLEEAYGIGLSFDLAVNEDDGRLSYNVIPDSDLDGFLLLKISESEASVSRTSSRLQ